MQDKILLIHVFWLVGRGVKQLSQLLWNVSGQMNKDMNVNDPYLITSTFREVLIYIFLVCLFILAGSIMSDEVLMLISIQFYMLHIISEAGLSYFEHLYKC